MTGFGKNVIPRRAHKERAQPAGRIARHGLLEKKKDYKVRAKHANRKAARMKLLREKATMRNQDEFYHAMEHARTSGGVSRRLKDPNIARDRAKSSIRDAGLVATKLATEIGRTRRLADSLHFLDEAAECERTHIVFVSDEELEPSEDADAQPTPAQSVSRELFRDGELVDEEDGEGLDGDEDAEYYEEKDEYFDPKAERKRQKAYKELKLRKERIAKLRSVAQDIATERNLQGKGARRKVRDADPAFGIPAVYKWRQQRKK